MKNYSHTRHARLSLIASAFAVAAVGASSAACVADDSLLDPSAGAAPADGSGGGGDETSGRRSGTDDPELTAINGELPALEEPPAHPSGVNPEISLGDIDGKQVIEGDILVAPAAPGVAGNTKASRPWPGGVVAYVIDAKLPNQARVTNAMAHWVSRTGIRFAERKAETAYVAFVPGNSCSSYIGRIGGKQEITLAGGCDTGATIHEIGHAVGLWHEQSRSDRDSFVRILLGNVIKGEEGNFTKTTFESPGTYDLGSIMHYGSDYFSANGKPTMTRLNGGLIVPNRSALSTGDIAGIKAIYAGESTPGPAPSAATTKTTAPLNLRSGPATTFAVQLVMPSGATVTRTGKSQSGFDSVTYAGRAGWAYATYLTP